MTALREDPWIIPQLVLILQHVPVMIMVFVNVMKDILKTSVTNVFWVFLTMMEIPPIIHQIVQVK